MTGCRPFVASLGLWLATALAAPVSAQAPSWTLYDTYSSLPTISFADGAMSPANTASVYLKMSGIDEGKKFTMDTGSTGIVATSDRFKPGPNDVALGPGQQVYTSSGIVYSGTYYLTDVVIQSGRTTDTAIATSRVAILQVTNQSCLPDARGCKPNSNPQGFAYMGVGFDRGTSAFSPPGGYNINPFTSIVSLASGAPISSLRQGYRITNDGVTLGLDTLTTRNMAFVKLLPDASGTQPSPAWLGAPMTVSVKDEEGKFVTGNGRILPDSGINYAFLTPAPGTKVPTHDCPDPPGGKHCITRESNTEIRVFLPGQLTPQLANYQFTTDGTGNPLQPYVVELIKDGPSIFLNTGREFFAGFDYVYDAAGGYVGYRWNGDADSRYGQVTPSLALTGDVALPSGFASDFPTFLMDATTLYQTGVGTISGNISGSGGLTIGSGQVNFLGTNTYTGGTTVTGGATLGIYADSALGHASGRLTLNGGTLLAFADITSARAVTLGAGGGTVNTNGNDVVFGSAVTGVGGLTKDGLGKLTLSGANSYAGGTVVNAGTLTLAPGASLPTNGALTVNGGTLDFNGNNVTVGSLSGLGGTISLGSGTLTVAEPGSTTLAAAITGTGGLVMQGPGMLSLTGASTYTGPTTVSGGRLAVNGSITSNVTVGAGGNLGGSGTITGSVTNSGTLAPGNSIGTLNVVGSYTQAAGSTYQVETNGAGQADRINVTGVPGTATISGGTVSVTDATGIYAPSTTYTILNAAGGVTGTFTGVSSLFPFLQPSLGYDANNVYLTLKPGGFAAGAATANQSAVGRVLDQSVAGSSGDFATVIGTLATFSVAQGQAAMAAISGQNYAGFGPANLGGGLMFMNVLGQQMSIARGGQDRGKGSSRTALALACDVACDGAPPSPWSLWGSALGATGSVTGNGNTATLTYNGGGVATGADYRFDPRFLAGIGLGYASGNQWLGGFSGRGSSDSYQASLYASFTQSAFYLDALGGYGYNDNQMTRQILIPGLPARTAMGRTGANQLLGQAEAGYRVGIYERAAASLTPFARFQATSVNQAAFSETGANSLNLNVAQQTTSSLRTVLGAELAGALDAGWREKLALQLRLGWAHEYASTSRPVTAAFAGAPGANFTVFGAAPQRDTVAIGLAADTAIAAGASLYLRYDGEVGTGSDSHALSAGIRMMW